MGILQTTYLNNIEYNAAWNKANDINNVTYTKSNSTTYNISTSSQKQLGHLIKTAISLKEEGEHLMNKLNNRMWDASINHYDVHGDLLLAQIHGIRVKEEAVNQMMPHYIVFYTFSKTLNLFENIEWINDVISKKFNMEQQNEITELQKYVTMQFAKVSIAFVTSIISDNPIYPILEISNTFKYAMSNKFNLKTESLIKVGLSLIGIGLTAAIGGTAGLMLAVKGMAIQEGFSLLIDGINYFAPDNVILKATIPLIGNVASIMTFVLDYKSSMIEGARKCVVLASDVTSIARSILETIDNLDYKGIGDAITQALEYATAESSNVPFTLHNFGAFSSNSTNYYSDIEISGTELSYSDVNSDHNDVLFT